MDRSPLARPGRAANAATTDAQALPKLCPRLGWRWGTTRQSHGQRRDATPPLQHPDRRLRLRARRGRPGGARAPARAARGRVLRRRRGAGRGGPHAGHPAHDPCRAPRTAAAPARERPPATGGGASAASPPSTPAPVGPTPPAAPRPKPHAAARAPSPARPPPPAARHRARGRAGPGRPRAAARRLRRARAAPAPPGAARARPCGHARAATVEGVTMTDRPSPPFRPRGSGARPACCPS